MRTVLKFVILIWMIAVIVSAFLWLPPAGGGFRDASAARVMVFHVPNAMIATIMSIISAIFALRYLKNRNLLDDAHSQVGARLATISWLLTTITGALFAKVEWGQYWNWDPKQSAIFVLLLMYAGYFALRSSVVNPHKQATVAAGWIVFAAITSPFLTYVLPNEVPSLHPKGVVFSMKGMDHVYTTVFWSCTIGLMAFMAWMYRVEMAYERVRLDFEGHTMKKGGVERRPIKYEKEPVK